MLVYNFKCNSCNAGYIGKIKRHYRTRTLEHIGVSPLTGNCVKNNSQTSSVHDHMLFCKTVVCPEDFSILAKSSEHASSSKYVRVLTMLLLLNMLVFWLYLSWNIWKFRFLKCEEFFPGFRSLKYKKNFWVFLEKI